MTAIRRLQSIAALVFVFSFLWTRQAEGHIALLMSEAIGGAGETTSAGHAAIYLSNVCGNQFTGLRVCREGEAGIVLSAYPDLGLRQKYEWMAVPLPYYLFGRAAAADVPLYANGKIRALVRKEYGEQFLQGELAEPDPAERGKIRWMQMIGVSYSRDVYALTIATTKEEDRQFIAAFNQRPNVGHFNTMYANCADFATTVLNTYFPHTFHRDYLNDFTMSTPKALARQLVLGLARKHPERELSIQKFAQVAGPIKRSFENRNFSEEAFKSKKYLITEAILNQELLAVFVGSYYLTAHFDVNAQYKHFCTRETASLQSVDELRPAPRISRFISDFIEASNSSRERTFATRQTWDRYRAAFGPMMQQAVANHYFADRREVSTFFRDLERQSEPEWTAGGFQLHVTTGGREASLGISRTNILGPDSDPVLAYKLLLALVKSDLDASANNRHEFDVFEANWQLLQRAAATHAGVAPERDQRRFLDQPVVAPVKKRLLRDFLFITH